MGFNSTQFYNDVNANVTDECKSPSIYFTSLDLRFFGLSLIIPVGLVCNSLSLAVFMSRAMRRRASSWYLAALAVSDNLSLFAVAFDYWLKDDRIGIKIIKSSTVVCIVVSHLSYASRLLSALLVTTFTIERFIGVVFPLRRSLLLSISHARCVIGAEIVLCAALATFTTFTIGIDTTQSRKLGFNDTDCDVVEGMAHIYAGFNVSFLIVGSIVGPVLIIVVLNGAIFSRVVQRARMHLHADDVRGYCTTCGTQGHLTAVVRSSNFHQQQHQHVLQTSSLSLSQQHQHSQQNHHLHHHHHDYNVTVLLLVVSTTFVVLNVPYCVSWFALFMKVGGVTAGESGSVEQLAACAERQLIGRLHAAKYIASVPYYLNYGINFALYSVCARAFRKQLCRVAFALRHRATSCSRQSASTTKATEAAGPVGVHGAVFGASPCPVGRTEHPGLVCNMVRRDHSRRAEHGGGVFEQRCDDVLEANGSLRRHQRQPEYQRHHHQQQQSPQQHPVAVADERNMTHTAAAATTGVLP